MKRLRNAIYAMGRVLRALFLWRSIFVDEHTAFEREMRCRMCPLYDDDAAVCTECKCFVGIKVRLATEECPIGNWK